VLPHCRKNSVFGKFGKNHALFHKSRFTLYALRFTHHASHSSLKQVHHFVHISRCHPDFSDDGCCCDRCDFRRFHKLATRNQTEGQRCEEGVASAGDIVNLNPQRWYVSQSLTIGEKGTTITTEGDNQALDFKLL
jgi:hypothetical protein